MCTRHATWSRRFRRIVGGLGSGQHRWPKMDTVDAWWVVDADDLPRPISHLAIGRVAVSRRGHQTLAESMVVVSPLGTFVELVTAVDGERDRTFLLIDRLPLLFGGGRTYWRCPGLHDRPCGDRVLKLYRPHPTKSGYACRKCHCLAYMTSQHRPVTMDQVRRWRRQLEKSNDQPPSLEQVQRHLEQLRTSYDRR